MVGGWQAGHQLADPAVTAAQVAASSAPWTLAGSLSALLLLVGHAAFGLLDGHGPESQWVPNIVGNSETTSALVSARLDEECVLHARSLLSAGVCRTN